jgi:hypothetical protein
MRVTNFRYVVHERVPDYLLCGWLAHPSLEETYHGQYSALLEWRCQCRMVEPDRRSFAIIRRDGVSGHD